MSITSEDKRRVIHNKIDEIFDKYEDDAYMNTRAFNYIVGQLPIILNNIKIDHDQRTQRMEDLSADQDVFIQSFLMINQYYYCQTSEKFFLYDGLHFKVVNEDDVIHHILRTIRNDKQLMCWKERTRIYIMKRIRENSLLGCVPESETIQYVLDSLYPAIFSTKSEAKYFLCILGDSIMKKNTELIHFLNPKSKKFIRELNSICQLLIGTNLYNTIRHKYYEHDYTNCRILNINDCISSDNVWKSIVNEVALDLICVACHYSTRYNNSDEYILQSCNDPFLVEKSFYLKNTTQNDLCLMFVTDYLQIQRKPRSNSEPDIEISANTANQITWKDMQYLWKQFLYSKELPQIMFLATLKTNLINQLSDYYRESSDSFVGITCLHLPIIRRFLSFWESNITIDKENGMQYEIGEICNLIKKWNNNIGEDFGNSSRNIGEKQLLDLIMDFYPNVTIEGQKYIYDIRCKLWDKKEDIQFMMNKLREDLREKHKNISENQTDYSPIINICRAYKQYCKMATEYYSSHDKIVSKSFFEDYVKEYIEEHIIEENCISSSWIM
jgi:hypothetical protein